MSEYIEREALLRALSKEVEYDDDGEQEINSDTVFITIEEAPTADVVPVVRGEWIQKHHIISLDDMTLTGTYPTCNLCDYAEVGMEEKSNYCPNCGAKMKVEHDG